jgi:hypothetical protein
VQDGTLPVTSLNHPPEKRRGAHTSFDSCGTKLGHTFPQALLRDRNCVVQVYRAWGLQDKFGLSEYRERYAAKLRREVLCVFFGSGTDDCHPDEAESSALPGTPEEGAVHLTGGDGAAGECIGPFDKLRASASARKGRGPQDDKAKF